MGFFSKLKNSLTGGWATVTVECAEAAKLGEKVPIKVNVEVKDNAISVDRIYVQLECTETIELDKYRVDDRNDDMEELDYVDPDDKGELLNDVGDIDFVDVQHAEELYEKEVIIAEKQELAANGSFVFEGEVELPADLPPTYLGRNCSVKWNIFAGLDMPGNDPDSGWTEIKVS